MIWNLVCLRWNLASAIGIYLPVFCSPDMLFYLSGKIETVGELNGVPLSRERHCGFFAEKCRLKQSENTSMP